MKPRIHLSSNRGSADLGWLKANYSFSFANWYNPNAMGVSALRVINEDRIAAHRGFGMHSHDNMEILTYILEGALEHKDSMGNSTQINTGEWQLMSAGTGIKHSEINAQNTTTHLLQIWIEPSIDDVIPTYQQISLNAKDQPDRWHWIVAPHPTQESKTNDVPLRIHQDADIRVAYVNQNSRLDLNLTRPISYLHVIAGQISITDAENSMTLNAGDALTFNQNMQLSALEASHVLWFELP